MDSSDKIFYLGVIELFLSLIVSPFEGYWDIMWIMTLLFGVFLSTILFYVVYKKENERLY